MQALEKDQEDKKKEEYSKAFSARRKVFIFVYFTLEKPQTLS